MTTDMTTICTGGTKMHNLGRVLHLTGIAVLAVFMFAFAQAPAHAFTVSVVDQNGVSIAGRVTQSAGQPWDYQWMVEEDTTHEIVPGVSDPGSLSTSIARSYNPVVAVGDSRNLSAIDALPPGRYYLSVLPRNGFTMSGVSFDTRPLPTPDTSATVNVHTLPLPTAQISVYAFHDNLPLNNAPDIPVEEGLPGFQVLLFDQLGQQSTDVFGNNLGTTYQQNADGTYVLDGDGNPVLLAQGNGVYTDANGEALIKNLAPGKYGVRCVPPTPAPGEAPWMQTTTLEGTPGIDAWVIADEPPFFNELGFFTWHAFFGFVKQMDIGDSGTILPGTGSISGTVKQIRFARPPNPVVTGLGKPVSEAWVALNNLSGADEQIYASPCDPDTGAFTIPGVPPGIYQLVIWDVPLDVIIDFRTVTLTAEGEAVDLGDVGVFLWFGNFEGSVFSDTNGNGFRDTGEAGIPGVAVNIRFKDGSMYQTTASQPPDGEFSFNEVFPFLGPWLVTEVDFAAPLKATGASFIVDDGGAVTDFDLMINPQNQLSNPPPPFTPVGSPRTELSEPDVPVLLEGMIVYAGQTNFADWGKTAYGPGEHGGITGIVWYTVTRAEDDPRLAAAEPWETGIPGATVNLYRVNARDADGKPVINTDPAGPDFVDSVTTDSFDDNQPTGCAGFEQYTALGWVDCNESFRTWNQMRPALFNGGYGFFIDPDTGTYLAPGYYVVEVVPPPGYEIVEFGDRNVDFGESFTPSLQALPAPCVGPDYDMPEFLNFDGETANPAFGDPQYDQTPCSCSMKEVRVTEGQNTAADFHLLTRVPKASRIVGKVFNDLGADINPDSPLFGLNAGIPYMPIALKNEAGIEIGRVYTDEFGYYNALLPGSFSVNIPNPTGVSPHMFRMTLNDPGTPANPDTFANPNVAVFDMVWDAWPGKTTILDTPNLPGTPLAAAGVVDCFFQNGQPAIHRVDSSTQVQGGPYVATAPATITITSVEDQNFTVPNPAANIGCLELGTCQPTLDVTRDQGFGLTQGAVTLNDVPLAITGWTNETITATVPAGAETGQLMVTRGDNGLTTEIGITLHIPSRRNRVRPVWLQAGQTIQEAIDSSRRGGTLLLVPPGTYYENLVMDRPIKLQGYGAGSTVINGSQFTLQAESDWFDRVLGTPNRRNKRRNRRITLQPGQNPNLITDRGATVSIFARGKAKSLDRQIARGRMKTPRSNMIPMVDGFTITGANRGSGVFVNAFARYAEISNNDIRDNGGNFGGGIRVGTPSLVNTARTGFNRNYNDHLNIHHNRVWGNTGIDGGGGLAIFNGADNYWVHDNFICGNFSLLYGGGIAHFGRSDNGWIERNKILYNMAFDEGGGIMLAGELVPAGAPPGTLGPGAGTVNVDANLIFGNSAGDDGGGIRTLSYNGQDVSNNPANAPQVLVRRRLTGPPQWHMVNITNNMIANNVSADAGAGISLDDTVKCNIINNTIANNVSTATSVDALIAGTNITSPQIAGISAREHSTGLQAVFDASVAQTFAEPVIENNIIWNNLAYHYEVEANPNPPNRNLALDGVWDLGVFPYANQAVFPAVGSHTLSPAECLITEDTGGLYTGNGNLFMATPALPAFIQVNDTGVTATTVGLIGNLVTTLVLPPLYYIPDPADPTVDPTFGTDYHITGTSDAIGAGAPPSVGLIQLQSDFDGDARPVLGTPDMGADQFVP